MYIKIKHIHKIVLFLCIYYIKLIDKINFPNFIHYIDRKNNLYGPRPYRF
jgi:hypothetical protein